MKRFLEFVLPEAWRTRKAARPEQNDATMARLTELDPVYRALADHAYALFEQAAVAAIEPGRKPEEREHLAGQAYGLYVFINHLEDTRERAKQWMAEQGAARLRAKG